MEIIDPHLELDSFFSSLSNADNRVLMLDYDGTLAPFRIGRTQALPYPGLREILTGLIERRRTRVIVISGRPIRELVPLLGLELSLEIWGCHGLEHLLTDGTLRSSELPMKTQQGLAEVDTWVGANNLDQISERKLSGFAFHWRGRPADEAERMQNLILSRWKPVAAKYGLIVAEFDGGLELRAVAAGKKHPVKRVLEETGQHSALAYLGDDITDEDAFRALRGLGLSVLVRPERRETAADLWIKPPEELFEFLNRWIKCGG
ncbi:MAG: trehalose-phosphatase [bacterium]